VAVEKWLFKDPPVEEEKITEIEKLYGVILPYDYKECIKENNGGFPEPNIFDCDDESIEKVFNNLISFTDENVNIRMFQEFSSGSSLFPFAKDPFGNLICFDYRESNESPKVVFLNFEESGETSITLICDSFTMLLDRLYYL
jgi:hypothetical protein